MMDIEKAYRKNFAKLDKKLPPFINNFFIRLLQKLFCEKTYNDIFAKNHYMKDLEFVENMVEQLKIRYLVDPNELKNIPSTGRMLVIANHITGASDAFSLVQLIANIRENKKVKLLVNGMLMGVHQAKGLLIPVDNISGSITKKSLQAINEALRNEEVVVVFPAGIVSRFGVKGIKDSQWKGSFVKIAQKNSAPVLPIKIDARNSILFYLLSTFLPKKLTGLMLPREFAMASSLPPLRYHIGNVVPPSSLSDTSITVQEYADRFYKQVYSLGTKRQHNYLRTEITIAHGHNKKLLKEEIEKSQLLGRTSDNKRIVLTSANRAPFLMQELGRVREISFRAIGGGTKTSRDNDLYDNYYKHLILWDDEELEIVGAYRIGEVDDIIANQGMKGLYTYNLCDFNEYFQSYCHNSVELGRSFVQPKYWGSRALDSLWQGVGAYLAKNPRIVYTYGTVTINADTPPKAVAALVYFYGKYFLCHTKMMRAKNPYVLKSEDKKELDALFHTLSYKDGLMVLKKHLRELGTSIPTLFKQYTELYEEGAVRFFDFSVNEELHGVVEGFIIADNSRMKEAKKKRYIQYFQDVA